MGRILLSEMVHAEIDGLLLNGEARTAFQAEEMFLDAHLPDLIDLVTELSDEEFQRHGAIKLLMAHGSRRWEDAL